MQRKLSNIVNKIRLLVESDINSGIDEYYLKMKDLNFANKNNRNDRSNKKALSGSQKAEILEALGKEVLGCKKCPLYKTRTNVVFGEGNPDANLLFIGEAPGRDEDLKGYPFVGRAGQLLTKIINAMGLERKDVYIANILKDRPPNNRNPKEEEILACKEYLIRQIEIINPQVICALGTFAAQVLLEMDIPISHLRGKFYTYKDIKFMPTYHPAYLLRNPQGKKLVWQDMKKIMKELGLKKK